MGVDGVATGTAYALVTKKETKFAGILARSFELSKQDIPPGLLAMACKDPGFRHVN